MSADFTHVPRGARALIFGAPVCWCCVTKVLTTIYLVPVLQAPLRESAAATEATAGSGDGGMLLQAWASKARVRVPPVEKLAGDVPSEIRTFHIFF